MRPYSSSAVIQSSDTTPRATVSRISAAAIWGLVWNATVSGMWTFSRRFRHSAVSSHQTRGQVELMIQQRRAAGGDAHEEDPDLAVVLLAEPAVVLPVHAGTVLPLLGEAALVDHPDRADRAADSGGDQLVGEHGLDLGLDVARDPRGRC